MDDRKNLSQPESVITTTEKSPSRNLQKKTCTAASSLVENLNSRLRNYFSLRRQLGAPYLNLLQFFLNHRTFLRSHRPERVGKSPKELMTGQSHPQWLELLGFTRFQLP